MSGLEPGELSRIGDYRLLERLGHGGMASVYKALHVPDGETLALKIFESDLCSDGEFISRAEREVDALRICSHRSIPKIHGFDLSGARPFIAIEYIDGEDLERLVTRSGPLDEALLLRIARGVGGALAYCHARGLFHRDIKPANIMLERQTDRIVLLDCGIVKAVNWTLLSSAGSNMLGTQVYMAPEQVTGKKVDGRTDIYQLGMTFFKLITSRDPPPPVDAGDWKDPATPPEFLANLCKLNPQISPTFQTVIGSMTRIKRELRYPGVDHLLVDLTKIERGEPVALYLPPRPTVATRVAPPDRVSPPPAGPAADPEEAMPTMPRGLKRTRKIKALALEAEQEQDAGEVAEPPAPGPPVAPEAVEPAVVPAPRSGAWWGWWLALVVVAVLAALFHLGAR
ncbi:MAG: serine/threonine protein kinase [Candidatus Riflebacteria bacterium]|nr:serine/threonine protein kinase [Candidatus Riflebacteria bacterium]